MGRRSKFTPAQKKDAVLAVISKRKTMAQVCRELGVTETTLMRWREQALEAIEQEKSYGARGFDEVSPCSSIPFQFLRMLQGLQPLDPPRVRSLFD